MSFSCGLPSGQTVLLTLRFDGGGNNPERGAGMRLADDRPGGPAIGRSHESEHDGVRRDYRFVWHPGFFRMSQRWG
jgi:hypothetical protein